MTAPVLDLVGVWTLIMGVGIFFYVLLDGFDLGIGILFALAPADEKPRMMATIAPVWDGNETWLILGAVALFTVFPMAFAIIIPAVYFPVVAMLVGLAFRGVAFEYRFKDPLHRAFWDAAFFGGSALATFAQGAIIGAFIQGFKVEGRKFAGTSFDWLTPFTVMTGFGLLFGYCLLGACWVVLKTDGELQERGRRWAKVCLIGSLFVLAAISVWTPIVTPAIFQRWFSWPNIIFHAPLPLAGLALAWAAWRSLNDGRELAPFVASVGLIVTAYLGVAISWWPMIVPPVYTLWDAASSPSTQGFLLVGTLFLLPVILLYTAWSYWVFRGKVRGDVGYH